MATSGIATFNYTRDQIVKAALRKIGAIESSETPNAAMLQDTADQLNILVKAWDATGIHIWTETEATLFLQPNQSSYILGSGSADNATQSYLSTTLAATVPTGATSAALTSAANILSGDTIGLALDTGSMFWTTVNGAPIGNTVTLTAGPTSQASVGVAVYDYTSAIIRPLRVVSGRRHVFSSNQDVPLIPLSRLDYRNLPNKATAGQITQFFYDPRGGSNAQGQIFVWPMPSDVLSALAFTWYRPIQDFAAAGNNPDLPTEWMDALIWNLARKMAPEFDVPPQRWAMIKEEAESSLDLALGWDREPESVFFGVNFDQR